VNDNFSLIKSYDIPNDYELNLKKFDGFLFQSPLWLNQIKNSNEQIVYYSLNDKDKVVGICAGLEIHSRYRILKNIKKELSFTSYPAIKNNDVFLLNSFLKLLAKEISIPILSHLKINGHFNVYDPLEISIPRVKSFRRYEFILDITKSEEELWKNFNKGIKYNIKQTIKSSAVIEILGIDTGIKIFQNLHMEMNEFRTKSNRPLIAYSNIFSKLNYINDENIHIVSLKLNNEYVSAAIFTTYHNKAHYTFSVSNEIGYQYGSSSMIIWEAIKLFKSKYIEYLNLGGYAGYLSSANDGLKIFKSGFGSHVVYSPILKL